MAESLEERLESCTLRLVASSGKTGTGFFVAPGLLLTASHVLGSDPPSPPVASWKGREYPTEIVYAGDPETTDFALLKIPIGRDHPCVSLRQDSRLQDKLYSFSYSDTYPKGESLTFVYDGYVRKANSENLTIEYLKFTQGSIEGGMSGSPVVNLNTGSVVGLLIETRGARTLLGGNAIGARTILEILPDISRQQTVFNARKWRELTQSVNGRNELDRLDKTSHPGHFTLFPQDPVPVDDICIEPHYQIVNFPDFTFQLIPERKRGGIFLQDARKLLEEQKILMIFGPYGCGKTILTKHLQAALEAEAWDTCFITCAEIAENPEKLEPLIEQRIRHSAHKLCLFFDGLDETNLLDPHKKDVSGKALKTFLQLTEKGNVFVVINSRLVPSFEESYYLAVCDILFNLFERSSMAFLELQPFRNPEIEQWLDAYSNAMAKASQKRAEDQSSHREPEGRVHEERIYPDDLNKLHKRLSYACHNPLFLYMVSRLYYAKGEARIEEDVFTLYETFVDATVEGKFSFERRGGALSIQEISKKYRQFLQRMAIKIAEAHEFTFTDEQQAGWTLDVNQENYGIPAQNIQETIWSIARDLLGESEVEDINKSRLAGNVLSCYFLEEVEGTWRFKDNNILFFLLAEVLYKALRDMVSAEAAQDRLAKIQWIGNLHLHPLTLEILLGKLDRTEEEDRFEIRESLRTLFEEGLLLPARSNGGNGSRRQGLRLDTVAALVFLRVNHLGYRDVPFFFGELESIARAGSRQDLKLFNIVRSFLRQISIQDADLAGFDFSGYNFSQSQLLNARFSRCRLERPALDSCRFSGAVFRHCEIERVKAAKISGNAEFQRCDIDLEVKNPDREAGLHLVFKRSQIKNLQVFNDRLSESGRIEIFLQDCDTEEVILRGVKGRLEIRHGRFPTLKLEGSDIDLLIDGAECTGRKKWQENTFSRINLLPVEASRS